MRNKEKIKASLPPPPLYSLAQGIHSPQTSLTKRCRGWDGVRWNEGCVQPTLAPLSCSFLLTLCPAPLSPALGCSPLGTPCSCGAPHGHSSFSKCPPAVPWALPRLQVGICSRWVLQGCRGIHAAGLEAQPMHRKAQHLGTGTVMQCYGRAFT